MCVRYFVDSRKGSVSYADLGVQLDVFDEQRENDESQILDVPFRGVDINSHVDVFYAILRQVSEHFFLFYLCLSSTAKNYREIKLRKLFFFFNLTGVRTLFIQFKLMLT